jgi:beta-glucanase (GH16 family)
MLIGVIVLAFPGLPSEAAGYALTATPTAVLPGEVVRVSGRGFPTNMAVQLAWDDAATLTAAVKVAGNGTFKGRLVATNVPPGQHTITARGIAAPTGAGSKATSQASSEIVASVSVTILSGAAAATPSPSVVAQTAIPSPVATAAPPVPTLAPPTAVPATPAPPVTTPAPPPPTPIATAAPPPPATGFTFVDEFNGAGLAAAWKTSCGSSVWGPETTGWDPQLSTVSGGVLHVNAQRIGPNSWRGGLVDTWSSFSQRYGWFEARIQIPKGAGLWPAFWALQHNPSLGGCGNGPGELDVMEILANPIGARNGEDASLLFQTVHDSSGGQQMSWTRSVDLSAGFHVYGMEWRAGYIDYYLDGVRTTRYTGPMPNGSMYVLLNLAVGGWPGPSDVNTPSPASMLVDWVHVRP